MDATNMDATNMDATKILQLHRMASGTRGANLPSND